MTIFVDHYSQFLFVHPQSSTSAAETLEAKRKFERCTRSHGILIKKYHADNGSFASAEFTNNIRTNKQEIKYSAPIKTVSPSDTSEQFLNCPEAC